MSTRYEFPIAEMLTRSIVKTLAGVKTAAGFNQDLVVTRPRQRELDSIVDNLTIVHDGNDLPPEEDAVLGTTEWMREYAVEYFAVESELSDRPLDERYNLARADMEKAILAANEHNHDGFAINTFLNGSEILYENNAKPAGMIFRFTVHYRYVYGDPYSLL